MIFARNDAATPLHRPTALLLLDGYDLSATAERSIGLADAAGFRVLVAPWFALTLVPDGIDAAAGFELLPDGTRRPVVARERIVPDAIAALDRLDGGALIYAQGLAAASPGAFVADDLAPEDFAAWLDRARHASPPPLPFLLPRPGYLASAAAPPAPHPLAAVLPCPADGHQVVATVERTDAAFAFLDDALRGPADALDGREASLLRYLGRSVSKDDAPADPADLRLVEPGVGRAFLVDGLSVPTHPELVDFSAVGIGLTPYSRGGFVNVGRSIDGLAALPRAMHRKACADRLEDAGCRAGRVLAIVALKDDVIPVEGVGDIPAAIVVRGFRSVLRIKQLDPIGGFYHSLAHVPEAHSFFAHPLWEHGQPPPVPGAFASLDRHRLLLGLDHYAVSSSLAHLVRDALLDPGDPWLTRARARRFAAIRLYVPFVLDLIRRRLAVELGRDPETERPGNRDYVMWFAESLGRQFATFHKLRFLHDYHHPGVARGGAGPLYSLGENNVSLLAEFPDLDTGVFLDRYDEEHFAELFLTRAEYDALAEGFPAFHQSDVAAGRTVLRTLAFVALAGDADAGREAQERFSRAYETTLASAA
jgi:hypothetical protein